MDSYKEFQGKTLDQAIQEACKYFDSTREKLEIEIVNDAKTGIFGLVGARKAKIRARRMKIAFSNGDSTAADSSRKGKGKSDSRKSSRREESDSNESRASKKQGARKDTRKKDSRPVDAKGDSRQKDDPKVQTERKTASEGSNTPANEVGRTSADDNGKRSAKPTRKGGASVAATTGADASAQVQEAGNTAFADESQQERKGGDNRRGKGRKRPADRQRRRDEGPNGRSETGEYAVADDDKQPEADSRQRKHREDDDRNGDSRNNRGRRPRRRGGKRDDHQADQQGDAQRGSRGSQRANGSRGPHGHTDATGSIATNDEMQNHEDFDSADDHHTDPIPEANLSEMNHDEVTSLVTDVVNQLITPVIGETPVSSEVTENRVKVSIQSGDNSGLLIGREGQTLASFQYLTNRIVAKKLGVAVRVQLDTGDYRERQDDKLRDIALHLADKAKTIGKPQSTRPLSSYHRRIVHLALQEDDTISTRSKGDGPLKRVIIARKRVKNA